METQFSAERLMQIARWYFGRERTSTEIAAEINKRRSDVPRLARSGQKLLNENGPQPSS